MRAFNFVLFAVGVLVHVNAQPTETESKQAQLSLMVSPFKTSSGKYLRVLQVKDNDANEERVFNSAFLKKLEKLIPGTGANKAAALARAEAISANKAAQASAKAKLQAQYHAFAQGNNDRELFQKFEAWKTSEYGAAQVEGMMIKAGISKADANRIRERYYSYVNVLGTMTRAL